MANKFIDCGDYFVPRFGGDSKRCVSCGKVIEYAKHGDQVGLPCHRCSPRHERAVEAAHRNAEDPEPRPLTYSERLALGFELLNGRSVDIADEWE